MIAQFRRHPLTISNRNFGIEIEAHGISMSRVNEFINNTGVVCHTESYSHHTPTSWKIVTDCSVPHGFEVVSPILLGEEGIETVRKVCDALTDAGRDLFANYQH